jgi:putative PIN family toxin of toxin-antitoxin system
VRKAVFDTNVLVSAFITPGGRGEEAWLLALEAKIALFTSIPLLTELARKMRDKFRWDDDHIKSAISHVSTVATVVKPTRRISVLQDDPDNRVLECAREAGADLIVTGDRHLLDLGEHKGTRIVTLAAFLQE